MPGKLKSANSRLSWKAAISHELEGHRAAARIGKTFNDPTLNFEANWILEEIQASVRSSKNGIELTEIERNDLLEDALDRFNSSKFKTAIKETKYENYTFNELIQKLWITKN